MNDEDSPRKKTPLPQSSSCSEDPFSTHEALWNPVLLPICALSKKRSVYLHKICRIFRPDSRASFNRFLNSKNRRPSNSLGHRSWKLRSFLREHPSFVRPESRCNELVSLLDQPLPEALYITRPASRVRWGIPVPFSREHVTYVWFDALVNYVSAVGYLEDPARFQQLWPADVHLIGKDILRHHALYWPIFLHALGFANDQMPRQIFAHGWWKVGEQKMSKSLGNIVDPSVVIREVLAGQPYAADIYRYFLLREVPFGQDGAFSEEALMIRLHADLANDLGNLLHRSLSMLERYCQGKVPDASGASQTAQDEAIRQAASQLAGRIDGALAGLDFADALEAIFQLVRQANRYIETQAPWQLAKAADHARLHATMAVLAETIRVIAIALEPFMPSVARAIWAQLGLSPSPMRLEDAARWSALPKGHTMGTRAVLFPLPRKQPGASA